METTVRSLDATTDGHRAQLVGPAGEYTITVPCIIDATGRESALTSEQKRTPDPSPLPRRMAIFSHFHGVARAAGPEGGNILVVRLEHGWCWLIPIDAERTSVGLVTTVQDVRAAGAPPQAYFERAVAGSTKLRELLRRAVPVLGFQVTSDCSYFRRDLAQDRLVLTGDAAGFFDPIFSSGVYLALSSAKLAADLVGQAHAAGRALTAGEQRRYTRTVKRHSGVFQRLITALYDDNAFDVFMCEEIPWDLKRGLTTIVAGQADLTWPLWWRYRLFLTGCHLQRYWKTGKRPVPQAENAGDPALPGRVAQQADHRLGHSRPAERSGWTIYRQSSRLPPPDGDF